MRLRTKLVLTLMHHLGFSPPCPHPAWRVYEIPYRVIELGGPRFRCHECWLSWSSESTQSISDEDWADSPWQD